jgi:hypothetical protein
MTRLAIGLLLAGGTAVQAADVAQDAIDACIDQVRMQNASQGGAVLSTEYSEANSLVMLQDGDGGVWRCLVSNDGRFAEAEREGETAAADDGGGAMSGAAAATGEPETVTEVVRFPAGSVGTDLSGSLAPGSSIRYVLGAASGQMMDVAFYDTDPAIDYQIFLPDGSFLLDLVSNTQRYGGQLFVTGDHVIEVINRGGSSASYFMTVAIN